MKKQYQNLRDDGTPRVLATKAPKAKVASKPRKSRKPRCRKAHLDYTIPTFGNIISKIEGVGFIYQITITTALGSRYYVGSKSFSHGSDWRTYCSSSSMVQLLIEYARSAPAAMQIKYEVLEQVKCSSWLKGAEERHMRAMYERVGKDACINIATPLGYSLRTGKLLAK